MVKHFFVMLIVGSSIVISQSEKSIHQQENEFYSKYFSSYQKIESAHKIVNMQKQFRTNELSKTVFGYLPWWEYLLGYHQNIRYDLLTHIAVFSFEADSMGVLKSPISWPWNDFLSIARLNKISVIMCVTNFSGKEIHKILTDAAVKQNLFNNIKNKIFENEFNGVNIDFESLIDADKNVLINDFMQQLNNFLKAFRTNLEISFASPIVGYNKWNFTSLAAACDYLFLMGYDFYGKWSSTTGPSSPLTGGYLNISKSIDDYYQNVPANKIILGVPYYGNYWRTIIKDSYAAVIPNDTNKSKNVWVKSPRYREIFPDYDQREKMWDDQTQTPWLRWQDTVWNQIWYDNESSLELKYDFVISNNFKGIGIWALGYDNTRNELWNLISRKFSSQTDVAEKENIIPNTFELLQNYPNPFSAGGGNPSTVISYRLSTAGFVTLKVFDILGREVATLVNEFKPAGKYYSQFSILPNSRQVLNLPADRQSSQLCSGIYFYKLQSGNSFQIRKMVLQK